jgi:CheY-like chemotaxis protein/HPt (histidine-containing phosphotransfer) domain-containing protein
MSIITRHTATKHTTIATLNMFADRNVRVLLVEDNITNQQVALGILKKLGLKANAVANGAEAVKALESMFYDLVFMDVQMPVMDGLEATRRIRNPDFIGVNRNISIIAMTAHAMQGDREICIEAGMNDYITKPVSSQSIAEVIERWLPKEKVASEPVKIKENEVDTSVIATTAVAEKNKTFTPAIPVFDKAGIMERLMHDEELVRMMVDVFLEDIPNQIIMLKDYINTGDIPNAHRQAHIINGACSNIGGESMRAVAYRIEKLAKAGELDSVKAIMAELESEFELLKQEFEKEG